MNQIGVSRRSCYHIHINEADKEVQQYHTHPRRVKQSMVIKQRIFAERLILTLSGEVASGCLVFPLSSVTQGSTATTLTAGRLLVCYLIEQLTKRGKNERKSLDGFTADRLRKTHDWDEPVAHDVTKESRRNGYEKTTQAEKSPLADLKFLKVSKCCHNIKIIPDQVRVENENPWNWFGAETLRKICGVLKCREIGKKMFSSAQHVTAA